SDSRVAKSRRRLDADKEFTAEGAEGAKERRVKREKLIQEPLACPPKPGPVLMRVVQLAESQGATHAKTTRTRPHRLDPPPGPGRPRRRAERQPGVPQGRDFLGHLLPLEGPPGESSIQ